MPASRSYNCHLVEQPKIPHNGIQVETYPYSKREIYICIHIPSMHIEISTCMCKFNVVPIIASLFVNNFGKA